MVKVRVVSNLPKATLVTIEPLTEDDWEILELNSELAESAILKQVTYYDCMVAIFSVSFFILWMQLWRSLK